MKKRPKFSEGEVITHQYVTPARYTVLHRSVMSQLDADIGDWIGVYALGNGKVVLKKISNIDVSEEINILKKI